MKMELLRKGILLVAMLTCLPLIAMADVYAAASYRFSNWI
jgi:hypothetical protein